MVSQSRDDHTIRCQRLDGDKSCVEIRVPHSSGADGSFAELKECIITLNGQLATLHENVSTET